MRVTELIDPSGIKLGVKLTDKENAIDSLISLHKSVGNIKDAAEFKKAIEEREKKGSTAVGQGIAIPHGKSDAVAKLGITAITCPEGVDYKSLDGKPSNLLFMIAAPAGAADSHLEVLSRLMTMLMDPAFDAKLVAAGTADEFLKAIDDKETEKFGEKVTAKTAGTGRYRILAVTACPTGIAHTYMAAEALDLKAKEMGISIKVETDGSAGAKNVLTAEEIQQADGIIIAADRNIDMARFDGRKVWKTQVSDGIHKPEELINHIIRNEAPVYHHKGGSSDVPASGGKESAGHVAYKHLMNGVSHMLPFVVGGGILIAIAFLLDDYSIDPSKFGTNTPVAAWFKNIGGFAFSFMLPILAGYIAMSIADRPGLVIGFVGGYMASVGSTFAAPGGDIPAGFLGALLAGFVGGYLMLGLEKLCDKLPKAVEGLKPVLIYPLAGTLMIGIVMCAFDPFVAMLNTALTNGLNSMNGASSIVLGAILGGMMSIDMGGPFNKAAYVFGTASIASGNYNIMAAVMIGGLVPPIAIALATTFFKNRFTLAERKSGPVNYIMGLCFITEGAIPYAAADPLRVIPSCMVGAATAGALSMAFGCTLMAPHGGIFVFPVVGNVPGYLIALVAGSVVGMALLAILKRPIKEAA